MDRQTKIWAGIGGGVALLAVAAAGMALARPEHGAARADLDRDGRITPAEIAATARTRFAEADSNKDGKLTGGEIPRFHGRRGHGGHRPEGDAGGPHDPPRLDLNGDGAVTLGEYYVGLRQRLARSDSNGDGTISAEELAASRHRGRGHPAL